MITLREILEGDDLKGYVEYINHIKDDDCFQMDESERKELISEMFPEEMLLTECSYHNKFGFYKELRVYIARRISELIELFPNWKIQEDFRRRYENFFKVGNEQDYETWFEYCGIAECFMTIMFRDEITTLYNSETALLARKIWQAHLIKSYFEDILHTEPLYVKSLVSYGEL